VIIDLNPVTALASSYQEVILYNRFPATGEIVYLFLVMTVAVWLGIYVFRKLKSGFADVL
jgi:ABC-type polysaccharide/polyol phosphate export permease